MGKCCGSPDMAQFAPRWWNFTEYTPVIPKFYWDVYSQEERIKVICEWLWKTICFTENAADQFQAVQDALDELEALFKQFQESGFNDYYEEQVKEWIGDNLEFIYTETVKQVYFGLNQQGYFVAYIPKSWEDIVFDTGMIYEDDTYGRLILRWQVTPAVAASETVDQTPEIVR